MLWHNLNYNNANTATNQIERQKAFLLNTPDFFHRIVSVMKLTNILRIPKFYAATFIQILSQILLIEFTAKSNRHEQKSGLLLSTSTPGGNKLTSSIGWNSGCTSWAICVWLADGPGIPPT